MGPGTILLQREKDPQKHSAHKAVPELKKSLEEWARLWGICNQYEPQGDEDLKETYIKWRSAELALYAAIRGIPFDPEEFREMILKKAEEDASRAADFLIDYGEYCERRRKKEESASRAQKRLKEEESMFEVSPPQRQGSLLRLHK